jgi:hypothetical protein
MATESYRNHSRPYHEIHLCCGKSWLTNTVDFILQPFCLKSRKISNNSNPNDTNYTSKSFFWGQEPGKPDFSVNLPMGGLITIDLGQWGNVDCTTFCSKLGPKFLPKDLIVLQSSVRAQTEVVLLRVGHTTTLASLEARLIHVSWHQTSISWGYHGPIRNFRKDIYFEHDSYDEIYEN